MGIENIYKPVQNLVRTEINHFGLCWVLFFRHQDVSAWPVMDPTSGVFLSAMVFKGNSNFFTAQFLEKDRLFREEQKKSQAGPYVESTVQGILGGNNLNHITGTAAMMGERFGLLIKERNGEQRLIGSADAGAEFYWDYTSGQDNQSRKRNCKWVFESSLPVPIYQGGSVVVNDQLIPVGGNSQQAGSGSMQILTRFHVGEPGAPMLDQDQEFSHSSLVNKNVLVFIDGIYQIQKAFPGKRYIKKQFNQTTISFTGPVAQDETIEIFTY